MYDITDSRFVKRTKDGAWRSEINFKPSVSVLLIDHSRVTDSCSRPDGIVDLTTVRFTWVACIGDKPLV